MASATSNAKGWRNGVVKISVSHWETLQNHKNERYLTTCDDRCLVQSIWKDSQNNTSALSHVAYTQTAYSIEPCEGHKKSGFEFPESDKKEGCSEGHMGNLSPQNSTCSHTRRQKSTDEQANTIIMDDNLSLWLSNFSACWCSKATNHRQARLRTTKYQVDDTNEQYTPHVEAAEVGMPTRYCEIRRYLVQAMPTWTRNQDCQNIVHNDCMWHMGKINEKLL